MRSARLFGLGACLALGTASTLARADDISDLEGTLSETVVTTASKAAETSTTAPATSTTLTAEDMRRYGMHSLDEAIDFLSLGVVTANPLGAPDIGARGVELPYDQGNHFLLLVNGHAVNEPAFGGARFGRALGVPMEMIDHIEVILGPGSVLYGSNAMLGVINVITKRAKDFRGVHVVGETDFGDSAHADGTSAYSPTAFRAAAGAGAEFKLFGAPSEATMMLEYYSQGGPSFSFGPQLGGTDVTGQPTRYTRNGPATGVWGGISDQYYSKVPAGHLRLISGDFELNVHASTYERGVPYRSRFTHPYNDFDQPGYDLDRSLWFDLKHKATLSSVLQLTTRIYGDTTDYQERVDTSNFSVCHYQSVRTCLFHFSAASQWAGAEVQASFDWLKDATLVTLLGVDGRLRSVRTKNDVSDYDTGRYLQPSFSVIDAQDHQIGAYLQQTWQPARWFGLNAGARLDTEDRFAANVSPRVAASVKPWTNGTLKAIYAEAFRAPSYVETNYSSPDQQQALGLVPERVRSVEGSLEQRIGAQTLLFGVFRSWWSDMVEVHFLTDQEMQAAAAAGQINTVLGGDFVQYRNVSSIDNFGFNTSLVGASRDGAFRYGLNVTGAVAHRTDPLFVSTPVAVSPELFGNARLSYDLPGLLPTLAAATQFMGKRLADRAYEGDFTTIPYAPPQLQLRGTISGDVPGLRGLSYRLYANYAFADRGPYAVGPTHYGSLTTPELVPVEQLRMGFGLQYDLR